MSHEKLTVGIDAGSRFTKAILHNGRKIISRRRMDTGKFYRNPEDLLKDWGDNPVVATGYGRNRIALNYKTIPEIHAHCSGAVFQTGLKNFTLLDLGGQDTKVAKVKDGQVADFITNDKCAASCGRTIENLSRVLGMTYKGMIDVRAEPVHLTSTCAVFAESEAIGLLAQGIKADSIAAGIIHALVKRLLPDIDCMALEKIVFVGGLARSALLSTLIRKETGMDVIVPAAPIYNAAIGCSNYGTFQKNRTGHRI